MKKELKAIFDTFANGDGDSEKSAWVDFAAQIDLNSDIDSMAYEEI